MYELNENPPKRFATNEAYDLEAQQHSVEVHEKSCCGYLRRKYSFPLWQILLCNILLFAIIVVVILLSLGVLRREKAVPSKGASAQGQPATCHPEHKSSEGVPSTTEPATTTQPQSTTAQPQSTTTKPHSTTTKIPDMECDVVIVGGGLGHLVVGNSLEERRVVGRVLEFHDVFNWVRNPARVEARGVFEDGFDKLRQRVFPALNRSDTVKDMADDVSKANASRYITAGDFVTGYLSPEGRELLEDAYDLKYPLYEVNPESFMTFLKEKRLDEEFRRFDQRPEKGLSELVWLLKDKVNQFNGSIYFPETVTSVMKDGSTFLLQTTNNRTVIASKTVLAVGPAALKDMKGDVIQNIISHKILKSIVSVPAFFGAAVYKDAWWEDSIAPKDMFVSNGNCLGITMPYKKSQNDTHVLQTIANTGYCSVQWGSKLKISKDLVDREMKSALEYKFQRNISDALSTVYKYWENGFWYVQKAGTKFSVEEIRKWAKRPLPGSDVFLIGKAFYNFGGSLEDTFRSINETLVEGWKTELKLQP